MKNSQVLGGLFIFGWTVVAGVVFTRLHASLPLVVGLSVTASLIAGATLRVLEKKGVID